MEPHNAAHFQHFDTDIKKGYLQSGRNEEFKEMHTGSPASPQPKPPLAFRMQFFSFSRLSESLEQAKHQRDIN